MILLENATKIYKHLNVHTYAMHKINLSIQEGDFLIVSGASGSGKSTLLNVLGLIDTLDEGKYCLDDVVVTGISKQKLAQIRNEKIGFIFQSFNLISDFDVFSNIEMPLVYRNSSKNERIEKVNELLDKLKISHRKKHYPNLLSGGEQQRVAIARALVGQPKLLLADEPTGNLDSKTSKEVMDILGQLNAEGMTIVMVTHDMNYRSLGNKSIQIKDGELVE